MKRIDQILVDLELAPSRTKAQELVESGCVCVQGKRIEKPSAKFSEIQKEDIEITDMDILKYVSRAGLKLQGAINKIGIDVSGFICLDIGQSTGGFTDVLIQNNVDKVVGIEVGHDQIHKRLKSYPKVKTFEGVNAKSLTQAWFKGNDAPEFYDLIVMDVSFISITEILPALKPLLKVSGHLVSLVKPQFELGPDALNKSGIIKDKDVYMDVKEKILAAARENSFEVHDYFESELRGRDGNQEFFIHCTVAGRSS